MPDVQPEDEKEVMTKKAPIPEEYKVDHLIEALDKCRCFTAQAQRYIKAKWGYYMHTATISRLIREEGIEEWVNDVRRELVEDSMTKVFRKAIQDGDNQCLMWIMNKYKQHVDFLEAKEDNQPQHDVGEIANFMNLLRNFDANTADKSKAEQGVQGQ